MICLTAPWVSIAKTSNCVKSAAAARGPLFPNYSGVPIVQVGGGPVKIVISFDCDQTLLECNSCGSPNSNTTTGARKAKPAARGIAATVSATYAR